MTNPSNPTLPLAGVRVVECHGDKLPGCARLLADLGADVVLVEPPGGSPQRQAEPCIDNVSLAFEVHHANKRSIELDLDTAEGRRKFEELASTADLLIESLAPDALDKYGLSPTRLLEAHPRLVVLSVSDYGQMGPRRGQVASEASIAATSGLLCRSGLPGRPPLLPPPGLVLESCAIQAAWVAMLALWQQAQTGCGDWIDFSIQEAAAHVIDPPLGITGSASAGRSALDTTPHGRPPIMPLYPVIPCRDGAVRLCVLSPRQWQAMSEWLGPDHEFTDPAFGHIGRRIAVAEKLNACIAQLFAGSEAAQLVAEGRRRGVPLAALARPRDVLRDAHFTERGAFTTFEIVPGREGRMASGYMEVDGERVGWRSRAPATGDANVAFSAPSLREPAAPRETICSWQRLPLSGLRVLDLGVIVAGAEAGRLLADMGADVIKVETAAFPDGGRQSLTGDLMTSSITQGHRNKRSFGINLRSDTGRELFKQLAARSDVILSNFKPGTLPSLGLGPDVLLALNPRLVIMDSSALGSTGPLAKSLGYGPLVRAATGLSSLWTYPEDPSEHCDGVTIYPDHVAGRVAGIGVLALLLRRASTGLGGTVSISQAEIFLNASALTFLRESLDPGSVRPQGNRGEFHAPEGVYPCAGDDQWCAITVRDDTEWARLVHTIGCADLSSDEGLSTAAGRLARRDDVESALATFTKALPADEVERLLQGEGVPAGRMVRLNEFRDDPHLKARGFIAEMTHPGLPGAILPTEARPALSRHIQPSALRPAPYVGEHTREIAATLLELDESRIAALIAEGVLEDDERKKA